MERWASVGQTPSSIWCPQAGACRYRAPKLAWLKHGSHGPRRPAAAVGGSVGPAGWESPSGGPQRGRQHFYSAPKAQQ